MEKGLERGQAQALGRRPRVSALRCRAHAHLLDMATSLLTSSTRSQADRTWRYFVGDPCPHPASRAIVQHFPRYLRGDDARPRSPATQRSKHKPQAITRRRALKMAKTLEALRRRLRVSAPVCSAHGSRKKRPANSRFSLDKGARAGKRERHNFAVRRQACTLLRAHVRQVREA